MRHESRVHWAHMAVYGVLALAVLIVAALAIWSFLERQSLIIRVEPLPKVTVVTRDPNSRLAASWVRLLNKAEMPATLVPLETFNPIEGVVVFCDIDEIPPDMVSALERFIAKGGAIAFAGRPPKTAIGHLRLVADEGSAEDSLQLSETVSPLLARLDPGHLVRVRPARVAMLKESPRMVVDARWRNTARAAVMHAENDGGRYLWFGVDPDSLAVEDKQFLLMLRTAFRWVAGQPVSDGASGDEQIAQTLTPSARRDARENRFAFSVDRSRNPEYFTIRMTNRGGRPIDNPTVKLWLPPDVTSVALAGDLIMRRSASVTGVPGEGACIITVPRLARNEDRVMKLRIVSTRGGRGERRQQAGG